jgi:hypothetical protein
MFEELAVRWGAKDEPGKEGTGQGQERPYVPWKRV